MQRDKEDISYDKEYSTLINSIIDVDYFNNLRILPITKIGIRNSELMYKIRETVPHIENGTLIEKIIPPSLINAYLGEDISRNFEGVTGFITKWSDLDNDFYLSDIIKELALTYRKSQFFNGEIDQVADISKVEHNEKMVDTIYAVKTISIRNSKEDDFLKIPFGTSVGSTNMQEIELYIKENEPFTGNGFTSGPTRVIPEFYIKFEYGREYAQPFIEGDEIYEITEYAIKHIAIFDSLNQKWQRV